MAKIVKKTGKLERLEKSIPAASRLLVTQQKLCRPIKRISRQTCKMVHSERMHKAIMKRRRVEWRISCLGDSTQTLKPRSIDKARTKIFRYSDIPIHRIFESLYIH